MREEAADAHGPNEARQTELVSLCEKKFFEYLL